jgi:Domain of unknown function (DUF4424)
MRCYALVLALLLTALPVSADDGAASIAAGGLVLMKREPRIVMAKEVLRIGPWDVAVDYDFRNDSDEDITTAVAFPIPAYGMDDDMGRESIAQQGFDDFELWIDRSPAQFRTEARAFVGKRDVTELLRSMHVDISSFGRYKAPPEAGNFIGPTDGHSLDIDRLTQTQRSRLIALKAISSDNVPMALWSVQKKYYWTQTFPAHGTVHIRHEYTPVMGNSNTIGDPANYKGKDAEPEYAESCPTPALRRTLSAIWNKPATHDIVSPFWIAYVSFILTTANTWKTPIEDFTLIVERAKFPATEDRPGETSFVSFCWDGPVTQIDEDHFSTHLTNFVPKKELQIGYILHEDPTRPPKKK